MKFSSALNVDVKEWKAGVRMEREGATAILKGMDPALKEEPNSTGDSATEPKFGAGSEFMRAEREEARAKKYRGRKAKLEDQPWILKVGAGKNGRRFRGIRDGGVNRNTSYYVFFQAQDGAFEAVPVSEWYKFNLLAKYKALTAEEAEEQFEKRDKIMNYFGVMKGKKETESGDMDSGSKSKSVKREPRGSFKVSEMDDWANDSDLDSDEDEERSADEGKSKSKKGKGKNNAKKKKKKRDSDEEDGDSEPLEESDEGDFDTRELDYISSSSDEEEDEPEEEKAGRELTGVEDLFMSESEEEENAEKEALIVKPDPDAPEGKEEKSKEKTGEISESSASDSDDSDLDAETSKSALFLPDKKKNERISASNSSSRSQTPVKDTDNGSNSADALFKPSASSAGATSFSSSLGGSSSGSSGPSGNNLKRKLDSNSATNSPSTSSSKKTRSNEPEDILSEETVRRYLMRKPMTATELYKKFKSKVTSFRSHDLVSKIADILRKINPDKQKVRDKGKEIVQFYLRQNR